ncbi:MAG: serine protease [Clostridia bacterium]|nr:serine protease [Clostridia bacterium]
MNDFSEGFENKENQQDATCNPQNEEPIFNPVNLTHVTPVNDYKPMNKGLKIFAFLLALIILLTGSCLTGYFIGKSNVLIKTPVKVELESTPENSKELSLAKVYQNVNPSIVGITVYNASGNMAQASGIVYSKDGYIITNDHIYSEIANPKFKIYTHDGNEYDAKYIAGDLVSDLAVLKLTNGNLAPASFGNSDDLYVGQKVVAIGRPNDSTDSSSLTSGIISATDRRVSNTSNYPARLIQTDTPINPGSSGGALVNMYGQVVGVTASKLASVEYEGVGYAIPTTVMKRIVDELISKGNVVTRAKLGITYTAIDSVLAEINNIKNTGLIIQSVSSDSDLFGKISKGDIITKINNTEIYSDDMVLDIIENCRAGDKISITFVTENGQTKELEVKLSANIGQSSYTTKESSANPANPSKGDIFDFPEGE